MIRVIYHANCIDGFTAAWAVARYFEWTSSRWQWRLTPASYGDALPSDLEQGDDVVIVDFSYPREQIDRLAMRVASVLILDHHKSAAEQLRGLPLPAREGWGAHLEDVRSSAPAERGGTAPVRALFDMERSGAGLAWDFFHGSSRPRLIDLVEDRDLWRWKKQGSRELHEVLTLTEQTVENWTDLHNKLDSSNFDKLLESGALLVRRMEKNIEEILKVGLTWGTIDGYPVPICNVPYMYASEAGNILCKDKAVPFSATYYDGPTHRHWSLRSRKEGGMDVSKIAAKFGGGGHASAAGFKTKLGRIEQ